MGRFVGDVMDLPGGTADIWVRRGYAERLEDQEDAATDKMLRTKKRTRTRKHQVATK
jgi:hypothetical protein